MKTKIIKIKSKKLANAEKEFYKAIESHLSHNWDILDGRTKKGKPFKKLAKVADAIAYITACGLYAYIIVQLILAWMSI